MKSKNINIENSSCVKIKENVKIIFFSIFFVSIFLITLLYSEESKDFSVESVIDSSLVLTTEEIYYDSLSYEADSLFYYAELEELQLTGNAKILYENSTISADTIYISFEKDQAKATGRIVMKDDDQLMIGKTVYYDIETQTGLITDGASRFELGYYYGKEIRKTGDDVYDVDDGKFTTCDGKHPHFDIRAHSMRVYRDHMVVGKPVIFYVNEFPVFGLPFAAFSIKRGRKSGILIPEPGFNQSDGKYFRNIAFFYVFSDYADATISMDLLEKTGYNYRLELLYLDRYRYNGRFDGNYKHRILTPDSHRNDWYLNYRHFQNLPEKASFDVSLDFASSRQVWESEVDIDKRLQEQITSRMSYRKPFTASSFYASASYTDDLINKNKSIVLPSFSYSLPAKPIHEFISTIPDSVRTQDHWWKSFSMSWGTAGVHTGQIKEPSPSLAQIIYKNEKDSLGNYISQHHAGVRQNISLSWNSTFFGWLKLGNSVNYQDAIFDRDRDGKQFVHGYSYGTNSSASFTLYGIKRFSQLPVTAVRHIVTPSASFRYSPDFYEKNQKFYSFGGIGVSSARKARFISLNLEQKWQLKLRPDKNNQEKKLNDIFVLRSSSSYNLENKDKPWGDLNHNLSINPGSYELKSVKFGISQNYSATQKTYENFNINSWRMNTNFNLSGDALYFDYFPIEQNDFVTNNLFKADSVNIADQQIRTIQDLQRLEKPGSWSLTSGHDYSYDRRNRNETQNLRSSLNLKVTQNWAVSYNNYYDIKKQTLMSQSLTVNRDLHCWKITFTYTKSAKFWDYRIVLFNLKLPDSLKLQTRDSS